MPTYQYACTACGVRSEVVQKFSDDPLTVCEACGGRLRKIFSAVGIVFKGPGFYRTDSRANAKEPAVAGKQANGTDGAAKAAGDSASAASSSKESSAGGGSPSANGSAGNGSSAGDKSVSKVA